MNTRELEVMDARFDAWWHRMMPHVVSGAEASDRAIAKAAWEAALLAEGSASSEGAEAVGRIDVAKLYSLLLSIGTFADLEGINFEGRPISDAVADAVGELAVAPFVQVHEIVATYTNPQPAQGEPPKDRDARIDAALAVIQQDYSEESTSLASRKEYVADAVCQLIDAGYRPQGEHEQRSGEGSERRPIADEVVVEDEPYFVEVDKNGCASCGHERSWTVVGPGDIAEGQSWLDEEEADRVCERMNAAYYAGRESAHPRGLPAGSDALRELDREVRYWLDHEPLAVRVREGGADENIAMSFAVTTAKLRKAVEATAEQPSCGQDARDGERLAFLIEHECFAHRMIDTGLWMLVDKDSCPLVGDEHDTPQEAIDAAIAAQQRQGGAK